MNDKEILLTLISYLLNPDNGIDRSNNSDEAYYERLHVAGNSLGFTVASVNAAVMFDKSTEGDSVPNQND